MNSVGFSNCLVSSKFSMTKLRLKDVKKLLTAAFICKKANILAGLICFSSIFTISFLYYYVSKFKIVIHLEKFNYIQSRIWFLNKPKSFHFDTTHCEGNYEKSIPSVSPGFITIAIGVHPSRLQIKNKILRLF